MTRLVERNEVGYEEDTIKDGGHEAVTDVRARVHAVKKKGRKYKLTHILSNENIIYIYTYIYILHLGLIYPTLK